jgi:hypothetical protein
MAELRSVRRSSHCSFCPQSKNAFLFCLAGHTQIAQHPRRQKGITAILAAFVSEKGATAILAAFVSAKRRNSNPCSICVGKKAQQQSLQQVRNVVPAGQ